MIEHPFWLSPFALDPSILPQEPVVNYLQIEQANAHRPLPLKENEVQHHNSRILESPRGAEKMQELESPDNPFDVKVTYQNDISEPSEDRMEEADKVEETDCTKYDDAAVDTVELEKTQEMQPEENIQEADSVWAEGDKTVDTPAAIEVSVARPHRPVSAPSKSKTARTAQHINSSVPKTAPSGSRPVATGPFHDATAWILTFGAKSDNTIRPIVCNASIQVVPTPPLDPKALPCPALSSAQLLMLPEDNMHTHFTRLFQYLAGSSDENITCSVLAYLYTVASNGKVANLLINSTLVPLLLQLLLTETTGERIKIQSVLVIGTLIRFATYISPDPITFTPLSSHKTSSSRGIVFNTTLLNALTGLSSHKNVLIQQYSMAALGELLFYISTASSTDAWKIPGTCVLRLFAALGDSNEIVTHYATQTLCNIFIHTTELILWQRLGTEKVTKLLMALAVDVQVKKGLQHTAGIALCHVLRHASSQHLHVRYCKIVMHCLRRGPRGDALCRLLDMICNNATSEGVMHSHLNLVIMLLGRSPEQGKNTDSDDDVLEWRNRILCHVPLQQTLLRLLIGSSPLLSAKALLVWFWTLRCLGTPQLTHVVYRWLAATLQLGFLSAVDKILSQKDTTRQKQTFALQCILHLSTQLVSSALYITSDLTNRIHLHKRPSEEHVDNQQDELYDILACLGYLVHVVQHSFLRRSLQQHLKDNRAKGGKLLTDVAGLLDVSNMEWKSTQIGEKLMSTLMPLLHILSSRGFSELLDPHVEICYSQLYPSLLSAVLEQDRSELQWALQVMSQCIEGHYGKKAFRKLNRDEQRIADTFLIHRLLPHCATWLNSLHAVRIHWTIKMLACIIDTNAHFISIFQRMRLIAPVLKILGHVSETSVEKGASKTISPVLNEQVTAIVLTVVESMEIPLPDLIRMGIVMSVVHAMQEAETRQMQSCMEHLIEVMYILLYHASQKQRSETHEIVVDNNNSEKKASAEQSLVQCTLPLLRLLVPPTTKPSTVDILQVHTESDPIVPSSAATSERSAQCLVLLGQVSSS